VGDLPATNRAPASISVLAMDEVVSGCTVVVSTIIFPAKDPEGGVRICDTMLWRAASSLSYSTSTTKSQWAVEV